MRTPFEHLPPTAASHFRLHFYAAVSQVLATASTLDEGVARERRQALDGYADELRTSGVPSPAACDIAAWWRGALAAWEAGCRTFLPIRAVRDAAALDHDAMVTVFQAGLIEEDARFAALFDVLNDVSGNGRATIGALGACRRGAGGAEHVRAHLRQAEAHGLVRVLNADAPRLHRAVRVPESLWDAFRGERHERPAPWLRYREPAVLTPLDDLVVAPSVRATLDRLPSLVAAGDVQAVVVRGPRHNGRHLMLGALARALGRGVLEATDVLKPDEDRWRETTLLARALDALPVVMFEPGPGERIELPRAPASHSVLGIVLGRVGSVGGPALERAVTVALPMPAVEQRRALWALALPSLAVRDVDRTARQLRLTSGHIHRAAALARAQAGVGGRAAIQADEVHRAVRLLHGQALDALAAQVTVCGDWTSIAAREDTLRELQDLELRCRYREQLTPAGGGAPGPAGCGVRALFRGPSGTGKTLAARVLASVLDKNLYRVDLSAVVNKYIGETEKNLERILSRAEELDVVLLLDEGDALLTARTTVSNANDRYANLETNFLLQRLESFDGLLIVTTNAGDRIDAAFERRMDVVIEFQPAQAAERWELWRLHLPAAHLVDAAFLDEVATRCALNGGQVRNAVVHASLLAVQAGSAIDTVLLERAVRREYRKAGAVCPLRAGVFLPASV
jgi:hypothetical protein